MPKKRLVPLLREVRARQKKLLSQHVSLVCRYLVPGIIRTVGLKFPWAAILKPRLVIVRDWYAPTTLWKLL